MERPRADDPEVLIVGAGIGGLATALALHQRGVSSRIFESVRELRPLGVGINLLPHAMAQLERLGVAETATALAVETGELAYYNRHGQLIWSEPRGRQAGYPAPQLSIHRGWLQQLLQETVLERLGADAIVMGQALTEITSTDDAAVATFAGRDGGTHTVRAPLVVAADGIHSVARARLHPGQGAVGYGGRMLWRATTKAPPFLSGRTMIMAGYSRHKFVCYPITEPDADGLQLINWVAEHAVDHDVPPPQDWSRRVDAALFRNQFADWRFPWLDIPALIDGADAIYEYPLSDRDPLATWTVGRVTLLGDAAHAMYPFGSNGASQSILDAVALADAVAEHGVATAALSAYEAMRREPTTRIVLANRGNGPEQVMDLAEERAPDGFARIHDVVSQHELETIAAQYKQVAGFALSQVAQG
jgi:2-polyprenyl-6-methoxyphenol hydroxylase-like FAD-dependent oxidoreductase